MHPLKLTIGQLSGIAADFKARVQEGLAGWNRQIRCMPTYIPLKGRLREGKALVLDLGGSNLRAGIVTCKHRAWQLVDRSETIRMPWQRNQPFSRRELLDIQVRVLAGLNWRAELPLGYCFSYPAEPTPDRDVVLLKWAKGIDVPETVGQKMGGLLLSHLSTHYPEARCSSVTVINDTVAALLSGLAEPEMTDTIGLIVGTGTNLAAAFSPADISKLPADRGETAQLPVNLESGNYSPPCLTEWDEIVDRNSNNPGEQLLEKAVAGAYLGQLFKAVLPESDFNPEQGAAGVAAILANPAAFPEEWMETAALIHDRSADLVAALLAGLVSLLHQQKGKTDFRIAAEGSLFWGKQMGRTRYRDRVATTLDNLKKESGIGDLQVEFFRKTDTNLIGAAKAALS